MIDTQRLRELLAKATPGPWTTWFDVNGLAHVGHGPNCPVAQVVVPPFGNQQANLSLIAGAVNAFGALLNELERKDAEIAEAKGQIEHLDRQNNLLREALTDLAALYDTDEGCRSTPEYIAARTALNPTTGEGA